MKVSREDKEVYRFIKNQINNSLKFLNTKPFTCSAYFLKYVYTDDKEYLNRYEELFKKLSIQDKKKTLHYIIANLIGQKEKCQKKVKGLTYE